MVETPAYILMLTLQSLFGLGTNCKCKRTSQILLGHVANSQCKWRFIKTVHAIQVIVTSLPSTRTFRTSVKEHLC